MSPVGSAERRGFVHESCLYRSVDEMLDVVVPFVEDGISEGAATIVNLDRDLTTLVRRELDHAGGVLFPEGAFAGTAASRIKHYLAMCTSLMGEGAAQIRLVGQVPHPGTGVVWDPWARFEAAVNEAFADIPLWGLCTYDTRTAPAAVLEDVACTHPFTATPDGRHERNEHYRDPSTWMAERPPPPADPLELTTPAVDLLDPWPHEARHAVEALAGHLPPLAVDDLVTSVSELVANGRVHGVPPTRVRAWVDPERVVVAVSDRGAGPSDPFAGLLPPDRQLGEGGLGLWITHQLCADVALIRGRDGFTVRVAAGLSG